MSRKTIPKQTVLPRDGFRRTILGLVSLTWLPLAGFSLYFVTFLPQPPPNLAHRLLLVLAAEFFLALIVASLAGLIWAIATPRWLEDCAVKATNRLLVVFFLFLLCFLLLFAVTW